MREARSAEPPLHKRHRGDFADLGCAHDQIAVLVLKYRRGLGDRFVALPAERGELGLILFIRPEPARADLGARVIDDLLMRGFLQDSADGMALRAFEFQRADPFLVTAHRSLLQGLVSLSCSPIVVLTRWA